MPNMISFGAYNESDIWFKAANELGYKLFVVSPSLKKENALYEKVSPYIEDILELEFSDLEEIAHFCRENNIVSSLCLPCPNSVLIWQARLNTLMSFQGLQKKAAEQCCDKFNFHSLLRKYNLPRAETTLPALPSSVNQFEFPFIVKPNLGAGGIEISKFSNLDELNYFFDKLSNNSEPKKYENYIFQSFVQAPYHVGLNCVVKNRKLIVMSFNVRDLKKEQWAPFFTENIFPSNEIAFLSDENLSLLQKLVDVAEIDNWPLKIEVFANADKKITSIIEVNLRPGGTRSPLAFSKILGYNYALEQVKLCSPFHEGSFQPKSVPEYKHLLIKNFRFPPGKVSKIKWFEPRENIVSFMSKLEPGSIIPSHWDVTVAQTCGELILVGHDISELKNQSLEIESEVEIEYAQS